jgi:hypothetical protein
MPSTKGVFDTPGLHEARVRTPGQGTAGTDNTWTLMVAPCDLTVTAISETFDVDVTGAASNYFTHDIRNEGTDGTGTTSLLSATKDYDSGSNATAHVPEALTLS